MGNPYEDLGDMGEHVTLLAKLKERAQEEDWNTIDALVPGATSDPVVMTWAGGAGLEDPNPHVRDLAVSLLEKASDPLLPEQKETLRRLMGSDDNRYVQFRSAFALFAHGDRDEETIEKLHDASEDADVAEIAHDYLGRL